MFDINVDLYTIQYLMDSLRRVNKELLTSAEEMQHALQIAQGYLSGNQFNNLKDQTIKFISNANLSVNNITQIMNYLTEIQVIIQKYSNCTYE